jgi:alpha-mannosidase
MVQKIGRYSGNIRIDTSKLEEPDADTEKERLKWFGGKKEVKLDMMIKGWKQVVSQTTDLEKLLIHMVSQSHIDIAWMWRFEQTRKKAIVTFKKAIIHSKMFPDTFHFALSEPILLEWVKEDDPKLFEEIKEFVKKGNIELVGGSFVEPDSMMPSGESFIRQRLYGMRFYRDNFNLLPQVEWFLDSFGYNYGLPQILVKSGAKYFWTTKLTWNQQTTFPFVNFWWQGADGTRILTCNFGIFEYFGMNIAPIKSWSKYEIGRHLMKKEGHRTWNYSLDYENLRDHVSERICPHVGCFFGIGDGGHGPTHKEVAYANKHAELSMFKWSYVHDFFKEIEHFSKDLPIWNDELYLENHRGCFSNHAKVKRHNRKYENLLISIEKLALLVRIVDLNKSYPQKKLEQLWKITLKNQFHDVLPGSSIPEVYDDCYEDWCFQDRELNSLITSIGIDLSSQPQSSENDDEIYLYLFNPLSWERNARVFIPVKLLKDKLERKTNEKLNYAILEMLDGSNRTSVCQPVVNEGNLNLNSHECGWWTIIPLKGLSLTPAKLNFMAADYEATIEGRSNFTIKEDFISNGITTLKVNPKTGAIIELISKNINQNLNLLRGQSSSLTQAFLDRGAGSFYAWNLTDKYWEHPIIFSDNQNVKTIIVNDGPVFKTIEISRKLDENPVLQRITLFKDDSSVYLEYLTDWKRKDVMLKIGYNTNTNAQEVSADQAYCTLKSSTNPNTPCDKARYEKICHEYCDLSTPQKTWGLTLINEGKYAYDVHEGDMRLTMLRACQYPDPAPEAWVNLERKENKEKFNHEVPTHSGIGMLNCNYMLFPHTGGCLTNFDDSPNEQVIRKAREFNMPIIIIPIKGVLTPYPFDSLMTIHPNHIYLATMKQEEWNDDGGIIFRFFEVCGKSTNASITIHPGFVKMIKKIISVDFLERETQFDFQWEPDKGVLSFQIKPFELCTFKVFL